MGDEPLSTSLTNRLSVTSARTCPSQWVISAKHGGKRYKPLHLSLYNAPELWAERYLCKTDLVFFFFPFWLCKYAGMALILILSLRIQQGLWKGICHMRVYVCTCLYVGFKSASLLNVPLKASFLSSTSMLIYLGFLTCCTWISSACVQG